MQGNHRNPMRQLTLKAIMQVLDTHRTGTVVALSWPTNASAPKKIGDYADVSQKISQICFLLCGAAMAKVKLAEGFKNGTHEEYLKHRDNIGHDEVGPWNVAPGIELKSYSDLFELASKGFSCNKAKTVALAILTGEAPRWIHKLSGMQAALSVLTDIAIAVHGNDGYPNFGGRVRFISLKRLVKSSFRYSTYAGYSVFDKQGILDLLDCLNEADIIQYQPINQF